MHRESVSLGRRRLPGDLAVPGTAVGLVVFAHGSGSSRLSPRNTAVADALNRENLATLLFDLLTVGEADDRANVFDIELLGRRVVEALDWIDTRPDLAALPIGLFGASTGAAAALVAASIRPGRVAAVVSRGGRPDLAGGHLKSVAAPTLLIVGADDRNVLHLNETALAGIGAEKQLEIVPAATHLFEEPGALEAVARLAAAWFGHHLPLAQAR
jgi:pimeloyl-ACP methyl ester carboxylesterase